MGFRNKAHGQFGCHGSWIREWKRTTDHSSDEEKIAWGKKQYITEENNGVVTRLILQVVGTSSTAFLPHDYHINIRLTTKVLTKNCLTIRAVRIVPTLPIYMCLSLVTLPQIGAEWQDYMYLTNQDTKSLSPSTFTELSDIPILPSSVHAASGE